MASSSQIIQQAKKEYDIAKAKGDKAGMATAHAKADAARGYETRTVGSEGNYMQIPLGSTRRTVTAQGQDTALSQSTPWGNVLDVYNSSLPGLSQTGTSKGVSAGMPVTDTFVPETKSTLDSFYNTRNTMAGTSSNAGISSLNLNSIPQAKMDNTVRNTILAKASKQTLELPISGPVNLPEPTIADNFKNVGRQFMSGLTNQAPAGLINATGIAAGNIVNRDKETSITDLIKQEVMKKVFKINPAIDYAKNKALDYVADQAAQRGGYESTEELAKAAAESIMRYAKPFEERAAQASNQNAQYGKGTQLAGNVAAAVGNMIPAVAVGAATRNPDLGLAMMGVQAGGAGAAEAYEQTGDLNKALDYGLKSGLTEVGTEMLAGGIPGLGKGILDKGVIKAFKRVTSNPKLSRVLKEAADTVGEGLEEVISGAFDPYMRRSSFDPEAENASVEDLAEQFTVGALASLVLRAGTSIPGKAMTFSEKRNKVDALNELAEMLPENLKPEKMKFRFNTTENEINWYAETIRDAAISKAPTTGDIPAEQVAAENPVESVQPVSSVGTTATLSQAEPSTENTLRAPVQKNVGKKQGNTISVHKSFESNIPQSEAIIQAREQSGESDYDVVKVNERTGDVTFIKTDDFDGRTEPKIVSETTVSGDGKIKVSRPQNKVMVDKASYVPEDYAGFDVTEAKAREKEWRNSKKYETYDPKLIDNEDYFNERAKNVFGNVENAESPINERTATNAGFDEQTLDSQGENRPTETTRAQNNISEQYLSSSIVDTLAEHSPEQKKVMNEYIQSTDPEIVELVDVVENLKDKNVASKLKGKVLSNVTAKEAAAIKAITGVDVDGYSHHIDGSGVQHILNRHGKKGEQDHSMADTNDIARMEYVLRNYDTVEILKKPDGTPDLGYQYRNSDSSPSQKVLYKKRVNGTYYIVEAIPDSSKKMLHVITTYAGKKKGVPQALLMHESPQLTSGTLNGSTPDSYISQVKEEINNKNDGKAVELSSSKEDNVDKETGGEKNVSKGSTSRKNVEGNLGRTTAAENFVERKRTERDAVRERARDIGTSDVGRRIRNVAESSGIGSDINIYTYEHYDDDAMLGFIDTDSKTFDIFISENPNYSVENIAYHELAHKIHRLNQKKINPILRKIYDNTGVQEIIDRDISNMNAAGKTEQYDFYKENPAQMAAEYFCDIFSNTILMRNGGSWQDAIEIDLPLDLINKVTDDIERFLDGKEKSPKRKPPSKPSRDQYSRGSGTSAANQEFSGQINPAKGSSTAKADVILSALPKSHKAKTVNAIKASIMKNFKVNVYSKNFRRPDGVYAYFRPSHNIIAERYHSALGPTAHELGHKLDKEYSFKDMPAIQQMLDSMPGYKKEFAERGYKENEMPGEVVADFVMAYLTNPDAAYELGNHVKGTNFYDTFEKTLDKTDLKNIRDLQRDILAWGAQDSVDKALGMINYRGNKAAPTISKMADVFMQSWIDNLYGAQQFIKAVGKGNGNSVKAMNDTYEMLRKTLTVPSITSATLTEGLINPQGFSVGKSLKEVLRGVKSVDMPLFDLYLKDVHSLDWKAQGKRVYSIEMDNEDEIRGRITKTETEHPEFKETAEGLYSWWQDFTDMWLVGTGLHTKEFVNELHKMYPHYVPNFRKSEGIKGQNRGVGGDPVKRAKGSDLPTYSATENLVLQIQNIIKAGVENQALSTLHTLYNSKDYSETVGLFLAQVPPDVQANRFDTADMKKKLYDAVGDPDLIDGVIGDSITYFTPKTTSNDPSTVVAMINGKAKFYYITDEPLARAFMTLQPKQIGGMLKMVKAMTRGFTGLVTANNPLFAIANHARDIQHGLVMTESKYHALDPRTYLSYFKDLLVSYGQIASHSWLAGKLGIKGSKTYKLYEANAGMASKYMPEGDPFNKAMREIKGIRASHKKTKAGNVLATGGNIISAAFDLISAFNGAIESAPRLTAFRRTYEKGGKTPDSIIAAVHAAKEATVDFQRRGNVTAGLATAVPFVGASIAGIDQFRRITMTKEAWTTKEGRQRLLRAVISQAIPAVIMAMIYADDDDWNKLHGYLKDGYWMIEYAPEKFIKIPKEREISAVFGTPFQRAALAYLQPDLYNKEELASYIKYALETFTPAHETIGWGLFDAINNKTWYGGVLVPQRDESLMQPGYYDEIYDETTSRLAVFLAKAMPDVEKLGALNTPKGIEYAIDQLTGGLGDVILPATTPSTGGVASELLRRYMTDSVYSNKYSNEAYEILDELNASVMSGKRAGIEDENTKAWQKAFSNTLSGQSDKYTTVSDYYAEIRANNNNLSLSAEEREEKNREIRNEINRITEKLVKSYKAGGTPDGYAFADVIVPEEVKDYGITDEQYSNVINSTTGKDTVGQKYALATTPDLTAEQKSYLSETILHNKSYDEWGPAFAELESTGLGSDGIAKLYKKLGDSDTSSKVKQFNLASDFDLTAEQKRLAAVALLGNDSYDEWGTAYVSLSESGMTVNEFSKIDSAVSSADEADQYTRVLKSGEHKGELRTEAIPAGSKYDTGAEGHKSASRKKMEAIKAAYPNADKKTLALLYSLYDISEKLY